ncbi:hypothetical protein QR680_015023 [Steinernema hermaphroditum]|uniref:Phosphoribosylformylglycinamidine synthase n=1 Tax=Steinernema hermaphroditum TaxID=289476 RepID=A0AA39IDG6_9BILA|nr:hypothetical protein QR680_015023 [Steinernema hermaphroditum]
MSPPHIRYYTPNHREWDELANQRISERLTKLGAKGNVQVESETCFHVILAEGADVAAFEAAHFEKLAWLLGHNPFHVVLSKQRSIQRASNVFEIGPRLNFTTPYSTNAVSACHSAGIGEVTRLEKSTIFNVKADNLSELERTAVVNILGDRMTECEYDEQLSFETHNKKESWFTIDVLSDPKNLDKANKEMGLALDQSDIDYYLDLFRNQLKRNPTDVELFDLAQSNSEHSRHWFFKGRFVVDGVEREKNLFQIIQGTQDTSNPNNVIAFHDNSSSIKGFPITKLVSAQPDRFSKLKTKNATRHIIYSAETHNFPTGVSPFPGAATGTGGRIRDVHSTGRGAHEIAGVAGYSFGNLHLDNYDLPWETDDQYPPNMAHPREVAIEASNGASDYGNKFGEPVITGFARSFGGHLANGERCEYVKPIMFSGGLGSIDAALVDKQPCKPGMLLAKIGGPVYRIGLGGGAASSVHVQGGRECELDFGAVQRGDAEMEQKLHRIVRACIEFDEENPILSIHDQGAGGNGNVLKELVEGEMGGAIISADKFELGDETISIRELWGAEYQENSAILLDPKKVDVILRIAKREKCTVSIVGEVTGDNKVVLTDYHTSDKDNAPVNLDLKALGERPNKVFNMQTIAQNLKPLDLPADLTVRQALELVLRLPSVASKRYLTNKVDRAVTGLIAQQQCVGPLHTPVADVAVTALSFFDKVGAYFRFSSHQPRLSAAINCA